MAEPADFVVLTNAFVDPRGSDVMRGAGEYVIVVNAGDSTVDVGGWRLRDSAGAVVTIPAGRTIAAGGRLEVHSGPGTDDATRVFAGRGRAVLTNQGDVLELLDAEGRHRQTFTYAGRP